MKKNVMNIVKSVVICGAIAIIFSLISVRSEAAELQTPELSNASISKVSPENMEEYNEVLADIELKKIMISKIKTELDIYLEGYEWFYNQYGTKEELEAWIRKFNEDQAAAEKAYGEAVAQYGDLGDLKEQYDQLYLWIREEKGMWEPDWDKIEEMEKELAELQVKINYVQGAWYEYQRYIYERDEIYVYRGMDPELLMDDFDKIEEKKKDYTDQIDSLKEEIGRLYKYLATLEEPDEPIEEPADEIIYTDETFEFPMGSEQFSLYVKIHFVGRVRNQPEVARLLMTVTPTSNNYLEVVSKVLPDLSGQIDVELISVYGVVFSQQLEVDFAD
ncbi:hypothetical protein SAMN04487831_11527 [Pseudobutyrivibrio sp. UC1225]|uniref:hypothetical protein n=1 Tax=Pseudobutyrivibrio sp. UC1225 TaxID=1798185 RepID=UPI0008E9AE33|nr:hypothetical protein [Pseudobutyrivibrio sp. UC1225]SFO26984.1 hypothetical protein SAMN04487831_11527 [Pseudobutyrivibrio sp. UC1225]